MKTYNEAKLELQKQAFRSGIAFDLGVNGKKLTMDNQGYALLDGVKVQNMETEVYPFITVDEKAILEEMKRV